MIEKKPGFKTRTLNGTAAADRKAAEMRRFTENLRNLMIGFRAAMEHELSQKDITLPQLRMLKAISHSPDVSAAALARACTVTPQTAQAILTRCTERGWIVRRSSEQNHRILSAALTPSGRAALRHGMDFFATIEARVWGAVSITELTQLNQTLSAGLAQLDESPTS